MVAKKGHEVALEEIIEAMTESPDVLLVGTGASGLMKVLPEVQQEAETRNIQIITQPTAEACDIYNQLSISQRMVAALHLTC